MKIKYNAPVTLTYAISSTIILIISSVTAGIFAIQFFSISPAMPLTRPLTFFCLFSHVLGHANWNHLISNFSFILLLGPLLEEKYGSLWLLTCMAITAFVTGILNNLLFSTGLMGASGIVFMMILLASFSNIKSGEIPLTFILIVFLFIGKEIISGFAANNISEFAHILGGICGGVFGFVKQNAQANAIRL